MQTAEEADPPKPEKKYHECYEELTGRSLRQCPHCQQGRMVKVAILPGVLSHLRRVSTHYEPRYRP